VKPNTNLIIVLLLGWVCVLMPLTASADKQTLPKARVAPKTYIGPEGMELTISPLGFSKGGSFEALIEISGHPVFGDRKIFMSELKENSRQMEYRLLYASSPLIIARRTHSQNAIWLVPDMKQGYEYSFHYPAAEQQIPQRSSEFLMSAYFAQRPLSGFESRANRIEESNLALQETAQKLSKSCHKKINIEANWKTASDDFLFNFDLSRKCATAINGIVAICDDETGRKAVQKNISKVECLYDGLFHAALQQGTLTIRMGKAEGEYSSRIETYLLNSL